MSIINNITPFNFTQSSRRTCFKGDLQTMERKGMLTFMSYCLFYYECITKLTSFIIPPQIVNPKIYFIFQFLK